MKGELSTEVTEKVEPQIGTDGHRWGKKLKDLNVR
jgi:hypothetical protein